MTEPLVEDTKDEVLDFTDELSDEALDREGEGRTALCGCCSSGRVSDR
jgi:hypothetical protein